MTTVAYAGEPGAFAEDAVLAAFGDVERASLGSFRAVFETVAAGDSVAGVVPIENVINGTVRENYDLLLEFDLVIRAEVVVPVSLCLAALPGQRLEDIDRVYSHIQALGQAEAFLRRRPWQLLSTYNTAGAGKSIADKGERGAAAVLSPRAAALFGLEVLADEIGDLAGNRTRFVVLARPDTGALPLVAAGAGHRTTLVVAVRNEPGTLLAVLRVFADHEPEHAQARVAAEPRAGVGVRLLGRHRRRHLRPRDGGRDRRPGRRHDDDPGPRQLPRRPRGLTPVRPGASGARPGSRSGASPPGSARAAAPP